MAPRRFELSLTDPYFWGTVVALLGLIGLVGSTASGSPSIISAVMFGVGTVALLVREYRRRVEAHDQRNNR